MAAGGCPSCGQRTLTVEKAAGGYVEILAAPSSDGTLMRLAHGYSCGKYVELGGPLLDKARADEDVQLYALHACAPEGMF